MAFLLKGVGAQEYLEVLPELLKDGQELFGRHKDSWVLQQDGAAEHTAKDTAGFLNGVMPDLASV